MNVYNVLSEIEANGGKAVLCTITQADGSTPRHVGSKMIVFPDGQIEGTIGGGEMEKRVIEEALQSLNDGKPRLLEYSLADPNRGDPGVCGGQMEVFVEPIQPKPAIVVVGGGHIGRAVVYLGKWLGYHIVLHDDRIEYSNPETAPEADEYSSGSIHELINNLKDGGKTYFVLTTRNINLDIEIIPAILETSAEYIGVIGSKRRWQTTRNKLKEGGVSSKALKRIVSPLGLEINAETPEEIALSIMAEIVMLGHGGDGKRMTFDGK